MGSYGRTVLATTGRPVQVTADGDPEWAVGGITIDWSTVTAVSGADVTYEDGTVVKVGKKGIPFGTIMCRQRVAEVQTITIDATGGTFTITYAGQTTAAIAENATAATVQAALEALSTVEVGDVVVTGNAGGPYTLTWDGALGNVAAPTTDATSLTGGAGTAVVATTTAGSNAGLWGPYDAAASDGRASVSRGNAVILNETILEEAGLGLVAGATDHVGGIIGGMVWRDRLRVGGGTGQPSWSTFESAFPRIAYAQ